MTMMYEESETKLEELKYEMIEKNAEIETLK